MFNSPNEVMDLNINSGVTKVRLHPIQMILLGIMAGIFIAIGGQASNVAMHNISDVGLSRLVAGSVFPVGLMMIIFLGGELFTGNCLIITALLDKKDTFKQMCIDLVIVYISNLIGASLVAFLVSCTGQWDYSSGILGAFTIKIAAGKIGMNFGKAVISGILCNILVCVAVLMATSATDIVSKVFAIYFPIWAFVISGFEHCVANMFYLPAGIFAAQNDTYVQKAIELYGLTQDKISSLTVGNMFLTNLLPVTIGNIIGGTFVGIVYYIVYKKKFK